MVDFAAGGEDVLELLERRLARDQCFGPLATQALLCRAGLRLLATAAQEVTQEAIRAQLRVEFKSRYGVAFDPGPIEPDGEGPPRGPEGGARDTEAA